MPSILHIRDALSSVKDAPSTFSSWDKCMQKAYCKWPVIVGIIVASIVVFSLLWCLIRCVCCGASCCCDCMSCCVSCCPRGGSGSGRKRRNSYQPAPYAPPFPQTGYQPAPAAAPSYEPQKPQFARFPTTTSGGGNKTPTASATPVNEDALPAMPTWEKARTTREEDHTPVETSTDAVELGQLNPRPSTTSPVGAARPGYGHAHGLGPSNAAAAAAAGQASSMLPRQNSYPRTHYSPPPVLQTTGFRSMTPQQSPHRIPTPHAQGFIEADSTAVEAPYYQHPQYQQHQESSPYQAYGMQAASPQSSQYHSPVYGHGEHTMRSPVARGYPGYSHSTSPVAQGGYSLPTSPVGQAVNQGGFHHSTSPVHQQQGYNAYQAYRAPYPE